MIDEKPEEYDLFSTVIGHDKFLNVRMPDKDGRNDYVFLRYSISPGHVLHLWMMSQDKIAAAVRAGKLKGVVKENSLAVGNPPRPDVDVALQDTSENIVKYIHDTGAHALFTAPLENLVRVSPAAK